MTEVIAVTSASFLALVQVHVTRRITSSAIVHGGMATLGVSLLAMVRLLLAVFAVLALRDWGWRVGLLALVSYHVGLLAALSRSATRRTG